MNAIATTVMLMSILTPAKGWFRPDEPININVKAPGDVTLFLTTFTGRAIEVKESALVASGDKTVDLKPIFPAITTPDTYVLYAIARDKPNHEFIGTPLVISVREDKRQGAPPGVM